VPTYQPRPRFLRDFKSLTPEQAAAWSKALDLFIACLRRGSFEPSWAGAVGCGGSRRPLSDGLEQGATAGVVGAQPSW